MYLEDDLLPISGIQHILYCKRQCALIYIEQVWADNFFTARGCHLVNRDADQTPVPPPDRGGINPLTVPVPELNPEIEFYYDEAGFF